MLLRSSACNAGMERLTYARLGSLADWKAPRSSKRHFLVSPIGNEGELAPSLFRAVLGTKVVMDGQLLHVCRPIGSSSELMILVATLRQEVEDLRAEVQRLQRENLELRQQAGYWKSRHRDALQRITELEQKVEQLEGEKRQLKADLFGRRTETMSRSDRSNDLDDPQDDSQEPQRKRGQQPDNPGPKRRDYSHLPVEDEFSELPAVGHRIAVPQNGVSSF